MQNEEQKAKQTTEAGMAQNPLLGAGHDPMPTEADYTYGAVDGSGEVYDQLDRQYYIDLAAWEKRNNVP